MTVSSIRIPHLIFIALMVFCTTVGVLSSMPVMAYDDMFEGQLNLESFQDNPDIQIYNELLVRFTEKELKILRNTIFARHGYVFKDEELNRFFNSQNWYKPNNGAIINLSETEKKSLEIIKKYENPDELKFEDFLSYFEEIDSSVIVENKSGSDSIGGEAIPRYYAKKFLNHIIPSSLFTWVKVDRKKYIMTIHSVISSGYPVYILTTFTPSGSTISTLRLGSSGEILTSYGEIYAEIHSDGILVKKDRFERNDGGDRIITHRRNEYTISEDGVIE